MNKPEIALLVVLFLFGVAAFRSLIAIVVGPPMPLPPLPENYEDRPLGGGLRLFDE